MLQNRYGGSVLRKKLKEQKKRKAVRDAGKKIKGKEAKRLKKMGITKDDIKKFRFHKKSGKLSKKASKIYGTKFKKGGKKKKKGGSKSSFDSYESDYMSQQSDIADMMEQFQIAQAQQMQQYEKMLAQQAAEAKKAQEEQLKMLQIQQQNTASAAQTPEFQLQGAGVTPKLGAAQQFRRRLGSQFGTGKPYTGLAQISSGMVNV